MFSGSLSPILSEGVIGDRQEQIKLIILYFYFCISFLTIVLTDFWHDLDPFSPSTRQGLLIRHREAWRVERIFWIPVIDLLGSLTLHIVFNTYPQARLEKDFLPLHGSIFFMYFVWLKIPQVWFLQLCGM